MLASVTSLERWRRTHSRPVVNDYCRWNEAFERITRANADAACTLWFIWPRVMLRTCFGV